MKSVSGIVYDPSNALALDLYLPDILKADACVVYVHGGQRDGRKSADIIQFAEHLSRAGFATAAISYRLNTDISNFDSDDATQIDGYIARSQKIGLTVSPELYGAAFIAAMEDISKAIEYLWVEGARLGIASRKIGILGVSLGAIAGLAAAYPPMQWGRRISRPEAVVAICGAFVQPWRLEEDGPACLLLNSQQDKIIDIGNARLGAARAQQVGAPVTLIETEVAGHSEQVGAALEGVAADGTPYIQMILDQFARLKDD